MKYYSFIFLILLLLAVSSCRKNSDKITTDPSAKLSFSQEEITFDTIFSSIGSITQRLWVYNENNHAINISRIQLARLYNSSYSIIVDGVEEKESSNHKLNGKDSMLILVKVKINPQNLSLPYLVDDSIVFTTNGNIQDVDLLAYGQDATFLTNTTVACNTTWTDIKPYVINGTVTVPVGCTLTIDLGTRVRFHKDAKLIVAGTLITQGTKDSIVTFCHDNLSNYYDDIPGQWGGIIFKGSSANNHLVYTEIKNATNGIVLKEHSDADTIAELKIENTIVKNCSGNGISVTATDFYAVNSLINNCVGYVFNASSGGNYYFDFCTISNFSYDFFREAPVMRLSNQDASLSNALLTRFRNTILWGDKTEEVVVNDNGGSFDFNTHYSILKSNLTSVITNDNSLFNSDPLFTSEYSKKFTLKTGSPAIDSGTTLPLITDDLTGKVRDASPDMGCYEK